MLFLLAGVLFSPAYAGGIPRVPRYSKTGRALNRKRLSMQENFLSGVDARLSTFKNLATSPEVFGELEQIKINQSILNTLKEKDLPVNPAKFVSAILRSECSPKRDDVDKALEKLWAAQEKFGDHNLFALFAQQYYSKKFGASPHMSDLFDHIGALHNRDVEYSLIRRLQFLAKNKEAMSDAVFKEKRGIKLPKKSFRVRYLSNFGKLSAENFKAEQLVLSIERSMSPDPLEDFPIRHINGRSVVRIDNKSYPVFSFSSGNDISALYTYLLYNQDVKGPLTIVHDPIGQSLALFNKDKTLWLRVSPHEYAEADNLHLHLNELRPVTFTAKNGAVFNERVNFNLSIPLATPLNAPIIGTKDFFYNQLIFKPVQFLRNLPNVRVRETAIY